MTWPFSIDSLLYARSRPPAGGHFVPTRYGKVRVRVGGKVGRDTIVLVPDGPCVIEHFDALLARLDLSYRTICFNLPGFGHSKPHPDYDHSAEAAVLVLRECLDALDVPRATLVFTCINGLYALAFAKRYPERVQRLVLGQTASPAAIAAWRERIIRGPFMLPGAGQVLGYFARKRLTEHWLSLVVPRTNDRAGLTRVAVNALGAGGCFCLASVAQGSLNNDPCLFTDIRTETVLLWGERDRSYRPEDAESLLSVVPHARVVRLPDSGHFPPLERPDALIEVLR